MKRSLLTLAGILSVTLVLAENTVEPQKTFQQDPVHHPLFLQVMICLFGTLIFFMFVAVLWYYTRVVKVLKQSRTTAPRVAKDEKVVVKANLLRA